MVVLFRATGRVLGLAAGGRVSLARPWKNMTVQAHSIGTESQLLAPAGSFPQQ